MNSKNENLAMLCDFYEFTMGNGYLKNNLHKNNLLYYSNHLYRFN